MYLRFGVTPHDCRDAPFGSKGSDCDEVIVGDVSRGAKDGRIRRTEAVVTVSLEEAERSGSQP